MKIYISFAFLALFFFACSSDDNYSPISETEETVDLLGEWTLDYYQFSNTIKNPEDICNSVNTLTMTIGQEGMTALTPCNTFDGFLESMTADSIHWSFGGITLAQCNPVTPPDCVLDGDEVEEELLKIWLNHQDYWTESAPMAYEAAAYENNVDSLKLINTNGDFAVYYR